MRGPIQYRAGASAVATRGKVGPKWKRLTATVGGSNLTDVAVSSGLQAGKEMAWNGLETSNVSGPT